MTTAAPPGAPEISGLLKAAADRHPDKPAVIFRGRTTTFRELEADVARIAGGLAPAGIGPGSRAVLMVPPSPEFFALTFAMYRAGAVPVLIDPGMGLAGVSGCVAQAEPAAFIGIPLAHVARLLKGWGRGSLKSLVTVGGFRPWGGRSLDDIRRLGQGRPLGPRRHAPGETAAVLFTSGSTGAPKGAVYTHEIFAAQAELLRSLFGIGDDEVSLPTFPLFALFDVALGMTVVLPDMDARRPARADPRAILGPIERYGVTQLFASPAVLDLLGRYGERRGMKLATLRRVISAGAPVPARVIQRFARRLPEGVPIHTSYGATEALPVATIASPEILAETAAETAKGRGVCVGRPAPGLEVALIRVSDAPIPAWSEDLRVARGEVGEFAVRGPVVTERYLGRPEADALAKISFPGGIWHRMGDLGYRDDSGRLWFCGRKSQRVRTARGDLFTVCCEGVFNAHPQVRRSALVGVGEAGRQRAVVCVELEAEARDAGRGDIVAGLRTLGSACEATRGLADFLFHPSFPVDTRHNSKIFRERLAVWAAGRLG